MQAIGTVHALIVGYDRFSSFLDSHAGADRAYRRMMTQRWSDAGIVLRTRAVTRGVGKTRCHQVHAMPLSLLSAPGTARVYRP